MTLRASRVLLGVLFVSLALSGAVSGCGGDDVAPPPPDGDAGDGDGGDAGSTDAAIDGGDVDANVCTDGDGDGYFAASCGGDDCDDDDSNRYPGNAEVCDSVDNDCNGSIDEDVCVPCAAGYTGVDDACTDVDECATGTDDCDRDPAACVNTLGSFVCTCPGDFAPSATDGRGANGCLLSDPSLSSLVPSAGALSPAFAGGTTTYTLALPPGATTITFTPTVAYPTHATITLDGVTVDSGAASAPISLLGFAPRPVLVTVTTESGATRTSTVVVGRSSVYVKASNAWGDDEFGWSVSLSSDGARLAVGAYYQDSSATGVGGDDIDNTATDSGAVYVFSWTGTTWAQEAYVKASNTGVGDRFGSSVSLSSDGTRLAVGATREASSATGGGGNQADNTAGESGAVYLFSRTGTTWAQEAYVKASNTGDGDQFGYSVSLSSDGTRLAVGAPYEDSSATGIDGDQADDTAAYSGAVYVFWRTGTAWTQEAYIKASNAGAHDSFGYSVSLSSDGTRLAASAPYEDSSATGIGGDQTDDAAPYGGAVYLFSRVDATWTQEAYVKASNAEASDYFGSAVSLSGDGTRLAVGAIGEASSATGFDGDQADNSTYGSGAAYVFSHVGTTWVQEAYVKASNTGYDNFGYSVSLSSDGTRLAVGALCEASSATGIGGDQADDSAASSGAVYLLSRAGATWTQEAYVKASNTGARDYFSWSVSLSSDGTRLAVGAIGESSSARGIDGSQDDDGAWQSGAVYVY
jgi:hypothetical protein